MSDEEKDEKKGGKQQSIACMACGERVERDHTGIVCMNDHHICASNGCALNFVNHVISEGPPAIPVKCMNCHVDVVPNTFERNVPESMQQNYSELCVLVGGNPEPGTHWHRCPLCPNMIIMIDSDGEVIYNCHECKQASCMICSAKVTNESEFMRHLTQCGAFGALRNEFLEVINSASQAKCPNPGCTHMGQKDGACTHMTCPSCHMRWCYMCGLARSRADGGEGRHNSNWEANASRCPMWMQAIHRENPSWPSDPDACVSHLHERRIKHALRRKVEEVGIDRTQEMLRLFPTTIAPFSMEEILAAEEPRNF